MRLQLLDLVQPTHLALSGVLALETAELTAALCSEGAGEHTEVEWKARGHTLALRPLV